MGGQSTINGLNNPFFDEIKARLASGRDVVILIVGNRREGKSIGSIKLAEAIQKDFNVGTFPVTPGTQNFFTIPDMMDAVADHNLDGKVITLQEMGVAAYRRNFAKEANKTFNMVMQLIGYRRLCFIWTLPSLSFLDKHAVAMAHYIVTAHRLVKKQKIAYFKVSRIQHNPITGKTYIKTFRFWQQRTARPSILAFLGLGLPSKKNFEAYTKADEAFKDFYVNDVRDRGKADLLKAEKKIKRELARDAKEGLE